METEILPEIAGFSIEKKLSSSIKEVFKAKKIFLGQETPVALKIFSSDIADRFTTPKLEIVMDLAEKMYGHLNKSPGKIPFQDLPERDKKRYAVLNFLKNEMETIRGIEHLDHISGILEIGELDWKGEHTYYIAENFIDGCTLEKKLKEEPSIERNLYYLKGTLKGVSYLHDKFIIHQDIKPSNIMIKSITESQSDPGLEYDEKAVLIDMSNCQRLSKRGLFTYIPGSTLFTAPEVLAGERPDRRSDIFSIGVTAYMMFTGVYPFLESLDLEQWHTLSKEEKERAEEDIGRRIIRYDFREPSKIKNLPEKIPLGLERIILRMMDKPGRRYASAGEALADLERFTESYKNPHKGKKGCMFYIGGGFVVISAVLWLLREPIKEGLTDVLISNKNITINFVEKTLPKSMRSDVLYGLGIISEAEKNDMEIISDPSSSLDKKAIAYCHLARYRIDEGDYLNANKHISEALGVISLPLFDKNQLNSVLSCINIEGGKANLYLRDYRGARKFLEDAVQLESNEIGRAFRLMELGNLYRLGGDYETAIKFYNEGYALVLDGDNTAQSAYRRWANHKHGEIELNRGNYHLALEYAETALNDVPENDAIGQGWMRSLKGKILTEMGGYRAARKEFEKAINCFSNIRRGGGEKAEDLEGLIWSNYHLARVYIKEGEYGKALEHLAISWKYENKIGLNEAFAAISYQQGKISQLQGNNNDAIKYYLASLEYVDKVPDEKENYRDIVKMIWTVTNSLRAIGFDGDLGPYDKRLEDIRKIIGDGRYNMFIEEAKLRDSLD